MKITYYITNLFDEGISIKEFENEIIYFCDLLEKISDKGDTVLIPEELYSLLFREKVLFVDYLYNTGYSSDIREYLVQTLNEIRNIDETYESIFDRTFDETNPDFNALVGIRTNESITNSELFVSDINKILTPHRYYLKMQDSISGFVRYYRSSFPKLFFHNRVDQTLKDFSDIKEHVSELTRHLSVLNDEVKDLFISLNKDGAEVYKMLSSIHNIYASGRGSNENKSLYLCDFIDENDVLIEIRCNPHTKLYNKHSDYRVYFHWGNKKIQGGKILIGHIGNHWE